MYPYSHPLVASFKAIYYQQLLEHILQISMNGMLAASLIREQFHLCFALVNPLLFYNLFLVRIV
jgi:hypothetical protein